MSELPKAYDPKQVEPHWFEFWMKNGIFEASADPDDSRPPYVVSMPPPNVTGSLHMGHALFGTIQDAMCRHKRMQGHNVLWQPGMDHAGIATQTVVERQLKRENLTRHDLGREKFVERIWEWKKQSGGRIVEQMHVLGCSAAWQRLKFTMDPDLSESVTEAFVRLFEEGLIYRDTRLINWDSESQTALSDLEVESEEVNAELYEFAYTVNDPGGDSAAAELVVATTRPETMLGDTAVAVHPDDERYQHLHGKTLVHPFLDREVPVITDDILVDMSFGTGAVKVTPAHDFNDFATGKRHQLEEINILNLDGTLNENAGEFAWQTVKEARKSVKRALKGKGLERGSKPHVIQRPKSQRSGVVVEPIISTQWFVKAKPLAEPALQAVRDGRTEILPAEWVKTYEHWLTNIQDWCISRQLWWGHRIPAFHCGDCEHISVTRERSVRKCEKCGGGAVTQDPDVLDTWFSSALWPFSTLGWPKETVELKRFYPSDDMETGYDILFFWVARMMMMGLHFMGEVPFKRVLLHGLIVDENGDKMSKVKGNTIDPLDLVSGADFDTVVSKAIPGAPLAESLKKFKGAYPSVAKMGEGFPAYGADSMRYALCSYSPQAKRIALSPKRIEGYRHFCNKIYNAVRYSLEYLEGAELSAEPPTTKMLANQWILSRFSSAVIASSRGIEEFRLDDGSRALYHFFWDELCDWFLELTKPVFQNGTDEEKAETRNVLAHVIEGALRALHPYIPFITEELWQRVPRPKDSPITIALAPYPTAASGRPDESAEHDMGLVMGAITAARTVRAEHQVHPGAKLQVRLRSNDSKIRELLTQEASSISRLVKTEGPPLIEESGGERLPGAVLSSAGGIEILVMLKGHVEGHKEAERIERAIKKAQKELDPLNKRLGNKKYLERAPAEVIAEATGQRDAFVKKIEHLQEGRKLAAELGD